MRVCVGEVPGLWNLGKSYLSIDTDGRVVRLDSFAKFLAPGFRLGWLTAHPAFVDKLTFHMHGTALGPCSTTQVGKQHAIHLAFIVSNGFKPIMVHLARPVPALSKSPFCFYCVVPAADRGVLQCIVMLPMDASIHSFLPEP